MNFKKIISLALVGTMTVSMIAGCGKKNEDNTNTSNTEVTAESAAEIVEATETPELEGYNLLWSDEFDGTVLDETKWSKELRDPGWTNSELQEYTSSDSNVFLRDGKLVLKAIKSERDGKDYYTSGKVNSQNKQDFMYGKVVVSAKVPEGQGLWPAIWMMPQDENHYGQWPKCGEIDIMEVLGNDVTTSYSTIHYGEPHAEQQGTITLDNGSFASKFHEYSVEWEPGEMRFYTDDVLVLTVNDWFTAKEGQDEKPYPAPFDQPFFVQMNLAVGGTWPGNPDETTDFENAEFEIDYVRVYQKSEYDTNVTKPEKSYREPLEDGNYIFNGDFAEDEDLTDDTNWKFLLFEGGVGEARIEDGMMIIESTKDGSVEYSVQLVQPELPVIKGHTYKVTFDCKADEDRDVVVCVSAPTAGWIRYLQDTAIDVTTDWNSYEFTFTSNEKDDNNGRLEYNMGSHGYTSTVYIKNVRYEDITE